MTCRLKSEVLKSIGAISTILETIGKRKGHCIQRTATGDMVEGKREKGRRRLQLFYSMKEDKSYGETENKVQDRYDSRGLNLP